MYNGKHFVFCLPYSNLLIDDLFLGGQVLDLASPHIGSIAAETYKMAGVALEKTNENVA